MVLLCARCAKILTGDEPATEVSAIVVTRGVSSDFESASQVGSHASFPQWEVGTEVGKCMCVFNSVFNHLELIEIDACMTMT